MAKGRILVVDDEANIGELLRLYLKREDFETLVAYDGRTALRLAREEKPDLIILDLMLPEIDGWEVCRELRKESDVPIIMLTARTEDLDRIIGLEMGADDYVTKPFEPREVVARVKAVLRRTARAEAEVLEPTLEYPGLVIDRSRHEVVVAGQPVRLTRKEFDLLWQLASRPGRVFEREQLLEDVWGYDRYVGDTRTVDTHIKRLRQKLETDVQVPWEIVTIWGRGYKFEAGS